MSMFFPAIPWGSATVVSCEDGEVIKGPFGDEKTVRKGNAVQRGSAIYMETSDHAELKHKVAERSNPQ